MKIIDYATWRSNVKPVKNGGLSVLIVCLRIITFADKTYALFLDLEQVN